MLDMVGSKIVKDGAVMVYIKAMCVAVVHIPKPFCCIQESWINYHLLVGIVTAMPTELSWSALQLPLLLLQQPVF